MKRAIWAFPCLLQCAVFSSCFANDSDSLLNYRFLGGMVQTIALGNNRSVGKFPFLEAHIQSCVVQSGANSAGDAGTRTLTRLLDLYGDIRFTSVVSAVDTTKGGTNLQTTGPPTNLNLLTDTNKSLNVLFGALIPIWKMESTRDRVCTQLMFEYGFNTARDANDGSSGGSESTFQRSCLVGLKFQNIRKNDNGESYFNLLVGSVEPNNSRRWQLRFDGLFTLPSTKNVCLIGSATLNAGSSRHSSSAIDSYTFGIAYRVDGLLESLGH